MNKNKIFNLLLHLSDLANDPDLIIKIMDNAGYSVSINQIRDWRRSDNSKKYKPVPSFVLETLFDYLFKLKKSGKSQIPTLNTKLDKKAESKL